MVGWPSLTFCFSLSSILGKTAPSLCGFQRVGLHASEPLGILILFLLVWGKATIENPYPHSPLLSLSFENRKEPALSEVEGMGQPQFMRASGRSKPKW